MVWLPDAVADSEKRFSNIFHERDRRTEHVEHRAAKLALIRTADPIVSFVWYSIVGFNVPLDTL